VLNAVRCSFIQNEAERHRPINTQFELVGRHIDFDRLSLLADRGA
jgi:hypothetical protein